MPEEPGRNQNLPRDGANSESHSSYLTEHKALFIGFQEDALQLLEVNLEKQLLLLKLMVIFLKTALERLGGINEMGKWQKVNTELKFTKTSLQLVWLSG